MRLIELLRQLWQGGRTTAYRADSATQPQLRSNAGSYAGALTNEMHLLTMQVNPWMRPEVEMIVAQDESVTGMFNWCVLL